MPPKRRRRFQGLYYHSSPPKGDAVNTNSYSYSHSFILIEGNCGDNTPRKGAEKFLSVFPWPKFAYCVPLRVSAQQVTFPVDCHIKWQTLMRHFRGTFEQFLLPLNRVCVCGMEI